MIYFGNQNLEATLLSTVSSAANEKKNAGYKIYPHAEKSFILYCHLTTNDARCASLPRLVNLRRVSGDLSTD